MWLWMQSGGHWRLSDHSVLAWQIETHPTPSSMDYVEGEIVNSRLMGKTSAHEPGMR
jgi:hypothetical protein